MFDACREWVALITEFLKGRQNKRYVGRSNWLSSFPAKLPRCLCAKLQHLAPMCDWPRAGNATTGDEFVPWEKMLAAYPLLDGRLKREWPGARRAQWGPDFFNQVVVERTIQNASNPYHIVFFALKADNGFGRAPLGRCWRVRITRRNDSANGTRIIVDVKPAATSGSFGRLDPWRLNLEIAPSVIEEYDLFNQDTLDSCIRECQEFRQYFDHLTAAGEQRGQDEWTLSIGIFKLVKKYY